MSADAIGNQLTVVASTTIRVQTLSTTFIRCSIITMGDAAFHKLMDELRGAVQLHFQACVRLHRNSSFGFIARALAVRAARIANVSASRQVDPD